MLYDSLSTLQIAVRIVTNVLLAMGVFGLLAAGYFAFMRPRRSRPTSTTPPSPRSLAKLSILALTAGAALHVVGQRYVEPRRQPLVTMPVTMPVTMIDTPDHYLGTNPALELRAPTGWTLRRVPSPDKLSFQVQAVAKSPPATLSVETMDVDGFSTPDKTLDLIAEALSKSGVTVDSVRVDDTIAGKVARGLQGQRADGLHLISWIVPLHGTRIGTVQCFSPTETSARDACAAPLQNLRWTSP